MHHVLFVAASTFLAPFLPATRPAAAVQLRDALVAGESDMGVLAPLADQCVAAKVPFRANLLGDGALWRAASIVRGEKPRWERNARLLPFLSNRAGQAYTVGGSAGGGSVINYGEVLGRGLYFKAEGTFSRSSKQSSRDRCPQDFDVAIREGGFVLGGREFVSGAISGPGFLRCLYLDEDVRIFESPVRPLGCLAETLPVAMAAALLTGARACAPAAQNASPDRWEDAGLVVVQVRDACFADPVEGVL